MSAITLWNAGYGVVFEESGIGFTITYSGTNATEGKNIPKIGV